jgi:hypothetical protein
MSRFKTIWDLSLNYLDKSVKNELIHTFEQNSWDSRVNGHLIYRFDSKNILIQKNSLSLENKLIQMTSNIKGLHQIS